MYVVFFYLELGGYRCHHTNVESDLHFLHGIDILYGYLKKVFKRSAAIKAH